jgi:hypothetical protein
MIVKRYKNKANCFVKTSATIFANNLYLSVQYNSFYTEKRNMQAQEPGLPTVHVNTDAKLHVCHLSANCICKYIRDTCISKRTLSHFFINCICSNLSQYSLNYSTYLYTIPLSKVPRHRIHIFIAFICLIYHIFSWHQHIATSIYLLYSILYLQFSSFYGLHIYSIHLAVLSIFSIYISNKVYWRISCINHIKTNHCDIKLQYKNQ